MSPKNPYIIRKQDTKFIQEIEDAIKQPQNSPLLFYAYGIGGIGKSSLIDKLIEKFSPHFQCAKISFDINSSIDTPIDLMKAFDSQTSGNINGWDIENFEELSTTYDSTVQKLAYESIKGDSNQNNKNKKEILSRLGALAKTGMTLWDTLSSGGAGTVASNAGGSLLQAGIDKGVDSFVEGANTSMEIIDLIKKHKATKDDVELQELVRNPLPKLAKSFVETIIQKSQHQPVILFIDTYEKASSEFDTFLCRYLLSNSRLQKAAVRIVMVGRYSLTNPRYQRMFQQSNIHKLEKQLKEFTPKETKSYLTEIGITKPDDIKKFSKATNGYPYYLNLIREQKEDGRNIELSRGGKKMLGRLLDGFGNIEKKVISLAAYCRSFDNSLIEYLIEHNGIEEKPRTEGCWFDWIMNLDFAIDESPYHFDDVARDIIRRAAYNASDEIFAKTNLLLFQYYQKLANNSVAPEEEVSEKYEDSRWCKYTIDSTYHALYADKKQGQIKLLTHFFEGAYLKNPEVALKSFTAVMSEADIESLEYLPGNKKFLQSITPAIMYGWIHVGNNPEKYKITIKSEDNAENSRLGKLLKDNIESALGKCFKKVDNLEGIAKCFALIGKYVRSKELKQSLALLDLAEREIEKIGLDKYSKLSSIVFGNRGATKGTLGEYEEALNDLNRAIELNPNNSNAWANWGAVKNDLGEYEVALNDLNQAIELNPNDSNVWTNRSITNHNLGEYEEALNDLNRAIELNPNNSHAWINRGAIKCKLGEYEEALNDLNRAIELNPNNSHVWTNRGITKKNLGEYEAALKDLNRAIELNPNNSNAWANRGDTKSCLGMYKEVLTDYNRAIELDSDNSSIWNSRALNLSILGQFKQAISDIDRAIELSTKKVVYIANKGIILSRKGEFDKVKKCIEKAESMNSDREYVYYAKACYFALQNKTEKAIINLKEAIAISPLKCKVEAKYNPDFDRLRDNLDFKALIDN